MVWGTSLIWSFYNVLWLVGLFILLFETLFYSTLFALIIDLLVLLPKATSQVTFSYINHFVISSEVLYQINLSIV